VEIRRGDLKAVFPLPPDAILGFEAAGVVDALGPSVSGVKARVPLDVAWLGDATTST
jgi:NADPH:quinone reductase-like Zn-dependent oxidoreductase